MNAYQWKQEAFGAAVDRGLYNLASQIDETNTADFSGGIPWHIIRAIADEQQRLTPIKSPPERSGTTGHNQTLTRAQKCAIIVKKAIRRHVRRKIKNYRRAKTMMTFTQMLAELERGNMDYTTGRIEDAAQWTLTDGSTIKTYSLGRDGGFDIIGKDANGAVVCYICTDSGYEQTGADLDAIVQAIKDGAQTLEQVFDMWENGLGGSPFDLDYLPEDYN